MENQYTNRFSFYGLLGHAASMNDRFSSYRDYERHENRLQINESTSRNLDE